MRIVALLCLGLCAVGCGGRPTEETKLGELRLVVVQGTAAPALEPSWEFGDVTVGSSAFINVKATNIGPDAMELLGVAPLAAANGSFFVLASPAHLEPEASTTVKVTFAPTALGPQTTRLVFTHDASTPTPVLTITGKGI